jgi:hypothetical protein
VRKTLGKREIAAVQATSIDQAAGVVNLTMTLANSSGESMASDWPVCSIEGMASPKSMGAASPMLDAMRFSPFLESQVKMISTRRTLTRPSPPRLHKANLGLMAGLV